MTPRILPFFFPNLGCPSRCLYCDQHLVAGEAFELARPEDVVARVLAVHERGADNRPLEVALFGGTFTALPIEVQETYLETCSLLQSRGLVDGVRVSTHPRYVSVETLARLRAYRVTTVELGVQSFADEILTRCGRDYRGEEAVAACRRVQDAGVALVIQLMPLLPGSLAQDDLANARQVAALAPEGLRLFPTVVLRGTGLARWAEEGRYVPATVPQAVQRVAEMLEELVDCPTAVLRIGLQPSRRMDEAVVAGPHHPALGELCWGRLLARRLARGVRAAQGAVSTIYLAREMASLLTGHERAGERHLHELLAEDPVPRSLPELVLGPPPEAIATELERFSHFRLARAEGWLAVGS